MKSDKNFKNKKSPGITLWDKDPPLSSFSVDCLLLSISVPWRIVCFSSEMPLEETKFSFSRGYQLDIASRLETRAPASVSQMLRLWARHISWPRWWFQMMMRLENARSGRRQWGQWEKAETGCGQLVSPTSQVPVVSALTGGLQRQWIMALEALWEFVQAWVELDSFLWPMKMAQGLCLLGSYY